MRTYESPSAYAHANQPSAAGSPLAEDTTAALDPLQYLRIFNRRKGVIAGIFILAIVCVGLYLFQVTPLYTAQTQLTLDLRKLNVTKVEDVLAGLSNESSVIGTEMDILRSSILLGRVVDKLHLTHNPMFNPSLNPEKQPEIIKTVSDWFKSFWQVSPKEALSPEEIDKQLRLSIIAKLQSMIQLEQRKTSNTLTLSFTASNPKIAAQLANTLAEVYLTDQLEAKFEATRQANEWLAGRLETLRLEVQTAEEALKKMREQGNIVQGKGGTLLEQQLGDINAQLIAAQVKISQAEARLQGAKNLLSRSGSVESLGEVLSSSVVHSLRKSESDLRRKKAELEQRYMDKHPQIIQLAAELKDVQSKLREESGRIVQNLENEVRVARAAETTLQRSLAELQALAGKTMGVELQLRELERQAESSRTLYQTFLARFQETRDQEDLHRPDARIIASAEVPRSPSFPQTTKVMAISAALGLLLGMGGAFLIESLDPGFRTREQTERTTGLPVLGMIPLLDKAAGSPVEHVMKKPFSALAESLRAIRNAIHLAHIDKPPKTVMITSSLPCEGKSTVCAAFGKIAALAGTKTLLIDADLRRPSLAKMFPNLDKEIKLEDLLQAEIPLEQAIAVDAESGLHVLTAHGKTPLTAQLLGSKRMQSLLAQMEQKFDLILFDTSPILGISDSWHMASKIDALIYLIHWAETPRETVRTALRQLDVLGIRPSGIVLSMVNMRQQKKYGYGGYGYYYKKYQHYYNQ